MQIHVEVISPVQKKISIEIPAEQVDAEIEKFYTDIQKKNKLQGFRPGKAPMQLVKRTYSDSMRSEVKRRIYEQTLLKTFDEYKIVPTDSPTVEGGILEPGELFKFSALVEVMPEIHLKEYIGLVAIKEKYEASPENIEPELKRLQENMARLIPLDDSARVENGTIVSVDYFFRVDGFPEESSAAEDAEVEVGANSHIPGFEEQLVGMKCGESKVVRVTLPEGYRYSNVDGKEGVFQVTLKEIKRKELPKLDDEFARQYGECESMQQLRAKMTESHEKHEAIRIENELKDRVIQALIEKNPLDVPESMVKRQLDHMLEKFKKGQHISIETMRFDDDAFRDRFRNVAADIVRGDLLLMALVEKENISVENGDLAKRYEQIAAGNPDKLDHIREDYESDHNAKKTITAEIKRDKAINLLLKNAVITEVDASELKSASREK